MEKYYIRILTNKFYFIRTTDIYDVTPYVLVKFITHINSDIRIIPYHFVVGKFVENPEISLVNRGMVSISPLILDKIMFNIEGS